MSVAESKHILVKKICGALRKYYTSIGKAKEYDANGVGLFTFWCEANGMDDSMLQDEFAADPDQSLLGDFPLALPPEKQKLDEDKKREAVLQILEQCRDAPADTDMDNTPSQTVELNQETLGSVTDADIEMAKPIYKQYCPAIFNKGLSIDNGLLYILAFQRKYRTDLLSNLVDSYNRYRVLHDAGVSATTWAHSKDHTHFSAAPLKNIKLTVAGKQQHYMEVAAASVDSFSNRCCAKLMLNNHTRAIEDSIAQFVNYLEGAIQFVATLAKRKDALICPFQLDFCVAMGSVKNAAENDDVDDDDTDDDDDDGDEDEEQADNKEQEDYLQNISQKLTANNLKHTKASFGEKERTAQRNLATVFKSFFTENKMQEIEDSLSTGTGTHYLHRKRLIAMVDRRKDGNGSKGGDDMYFYEPPNDHYTRVMPPENAFVYEWLISSSKTCILPNIGYDAEVAVGNKTEKASGGNIGASDHAKGSLVTLSFHVLAEEKIKLYLYWQGQMIRFLPEDIKLILPELFVKNKENESYIKDENGELDKLIEKLKAQLVDKQFAEWLEKYPVT